MSGKTQRTAAQASRRPGKMGRKSAVGSKLPTTQKPADFPNDDAEPAYFTRADWTQFRDLSRISAMAGVRREDLPRVVAKELADNALDAGGDVRTGFLKAEPGEVTFFVEDDGPGFSGTDEEIAEHFSIRRDLVSSKSVRLPTRGMLGNGIRVVVGVVLCSGGELRVSTRGRTLTLAPQDEGHTKIVKRKPWSGGGTRIEVTLRGELADYASPAADCDLFEWVEAAKSLGQGKLYQGKSSPHWYSATAFWELCRAAGKTRIERLIAKYLDGCSGRERVAAVTGDLTGRACDSLTRAEAQEVLTAAQEATKEVPAKRLGKIGIREDYLGYRLERGAFIQDGATIPFVVEAWSNRADEPAATIAINRTPIVTRSDLRRVDGKMYAIFGGGLHHRFTVGQKRGGEFSLVVNVITPFVPLTSSGKEPDLTPMRDEILEACERAVRIAKRKNPKPADGTAGISQKSVILQRLEAMAEKLSGGGVYLFSLRQLFYAIRPFLIPVTGREPEYGWFCKVIGEYEDEHGDIPRLYRDDRGTLYHPHTGKSISLGTRSVAEYERPAWGFNKIVYCEKEGFFPILQEANWPERHDCALLTSKGFATRAARDVLALLGDTGEPITFYCVHDADGPGTVIYEALARELEARGVEVINLGLDPAEGRAMDLEPEPVGRKERDGTVPRVPVAAYIPEEDQEWLQENRIELNAMTTPQFLAWLDAKMAAHAGEKVIPPPDVVRDRIAEEAEKELTRRVTEEVVREADVSGRVKAILAEKKIALKEVVAATVAGLPSILRDEPERHWSDVAKEKGVGVLDSSEVPPGTRRRSRGGRRGEPPSA